MACIPRNVFSIGSIRWVYLRGERAQFKCDEVRQLITYREVGRTRTRRLKLGRLNEGNHIMDLAMSKGQCRADV